MHKRLFSDALVAFANAASACACLRPQSRAREVRKKLQEGGDRRVARNEWLKSLLYLYSPPPILL
jgi:hypothetical protein